MKEVGDLKGDLEKLKAVFDSKKKNIKDIEKKTKPDKSDNLTKSIEKGKASKDKSVEKEEKSDKEPKIPKKSPKKNSEPEETDDEE